MKDWLRNIRKSKGLSQANIARKANISQQTYSAIETGERTPSVDTAKKIAKALDFDWTLFYGDEEAAESATKEVS